MKINWLLAPALAFIMIASPAFASENPAKDKAIEIVKKAAELAKAEGTTKALQDINASVAPFNDPASYVTVTNQKGECVGHSSNKKMIGKSLIELADIDGKEFIKEQVSLAKTNASFTHEYKFSDPVTKKIRPKEVYCEVVEALSFCAGFYK